MTVFLDGIATQFYRGIGDEIQYIAPFSQINFFIGANNAGKSIVLNLIATKLADVVAGQKPIRVEGPERYRGTKSGQFFIAIGRDVHDVS